MAHSHVPELRVPKFSYDSMPLDWLGGNPLASCMGNALHMVFPAGERFFVRSVMHYKDLLREQHPELWQRVRGFAGQEGQHGYQHERVFDILRQQGVPVDAFLRVYETYAFEFLEKTLTSPSLQLATTVAAEHLTATLARIALDSGVLETFSGEMRDLLHWHAMEELEHQHVTWDVLQVVDTSYATRLAGAAVITSVLFPFWIGGGLVFAWKRKEPFLKLLRRSRGTGHVIPVFTLLKALGEYFHRDYQPGKPGDDERIARAREWYVRVSQQPTAEAA